MNVEHEIERMTADYMGTPTRKTLPLFDLSALAGQPPAVREWIVPDLIPANEITLFTGPGGAGKSLLAQQLATCLARGVPFLGMPVNPAKTLYVTAEDDTDELHRRQRNILAAVGAGDLGGKLFLSSLRGRMGNELALFDRDGEIERTGTFHLLKDTIAETGASFLVLDNLAHLFGGNENDRGQVTRFANALYSLRRDVARDCGVELDLAILLIGHPNKSGDAYSGSTAWLNAVRSQIEIARPDECAHDPDARVLRLGKANYARSGNETRLRWHNFAFIADDEMPDSLRDQLAEVGKANSENDAFLACLRERERQGEARAVGPAPGPNYAPSQFEGMAQAKGFKRAVLKRAMDRLFTIGAIEAHTYRNTAKGRDVTVIREVPQASPNATPNSSRTLPPNHPEPSARTTPRTHSIPKGISGAAPDGPPRPIEDHGGMA